MRRFIAILMFAMTLGLITACEQEGPMEQAGEDVDQAVEETGDSVEESTDS